MADYIRARSPEHKRERMEASGMAPIEGSFADAYADYVLMCIERASEA